MKIVASASAALVSAALLAAATPAQAAVATDCVVRALDNPVRAFERGETLVNVLAEGRSPAAQLHFVIRRVSTGAVVRDFHRFKDSGRESYDTPALRRSGIYRVTVRANPVNSRYANCSGSHRVRVR
ncbi:MAG TPA: hypothetical protein VF728_05055 [Nocardioides sp.]